MNTIGFWGWYRPIKRLSLKNRFADIYVRKNLKTLTGRGSHNSSTLCYPGQKVIFFNSRNLLRVLLPLNPTLLLPNSSTVPLPQLALKARPGMPAYWRIFLRKFTKKSSSNSQNFKISWNAQKHPFLILWFFGGGKAHQVLTSKFAASCLHTDAFFCASSQKKIELALHACIPGG